MKILYHIPSTSTIYAGRTIYYGYMHAFTDLGHEFKTLTADDNVEAVFAEFKPDVFITSLNNYHLRYLDLKFLAAKKKAGLKVAVNIPFWKTVFSKLRLNESAGLASEPALIKLMRDGLADAYFNSLDHADERMRGFKEGVGIDYLTLPLAADKVTLMSATKTERFIGDVAYIGTYLPEKRAFFKERVFPLRSKYNLRLYGQDWTFADRMLGLANKVGQYYNIPYLKSIQKPKLQLEDEAHIYASTKISINVHEDYQKNFGGDCNERTFKIPLCGGFEITDDVSCIRKYFVENEEMVIAHSKEDWFAKIDYYYRHPAARQAIIDAGKKKVLREHTYHNRVKQLLVALKV